MDILELVASVRLTDVRTISRESTLRVDHNPDAGLGTFGEITSAGDLEMNLNPVSWGRRIETWFRMTVESDQFRIAVAEATIYERDSDDPIPDDVRVEFLERVAVMAAYPYLRAAVQACAADLRVGNLTLDVLRQGQFQVHPPEPTETPEPPPSAEQ